MQSRYPILRTQKSMLIGLITFFILLLITQYLTYQRYLIDRNNESEEVQREVHSVKDRLEEALNYSRSATKTLALIVKKNGIPEDFDAIAIDILESNKAIDALELAQGGIITHVYPLRGNEQHIGFNILKDTLRKAEAYRAIEKKELLFSGPYDLMQGGAIIGRLPIFVDNKFWGFSIVLVNLTTLQSAAGITTMDNGRFIYQLSKRSNVTGKEEFFLSSQSNSSDDQAASLLVPDSQWKIYVALKKPQNHYVSFMLSLIGVVLSVSAGIFAMHLVTQPEKLKNLVKETTSQLLISQNNYRSTLERLTDGFIAYDNQWRYTYINRRAAEILDLSLTHLIGKNIWTEFPELTNQPLYDAYISAAKYQRYVCIESYFPENQKWFENHIYPSPDGVSVFFRDVTESKKTKEKLEGSERYFRSLIEKSSEAIILLDNKGKTIYQSPSTQRVSGYSFAEMQMLNSIDLIHPDDRIRDSSMFSDLVALPGKTLHRNHRLKHKNGNYLWIEGTYTNLLHDENVKAIVYNYHDVTYRVLAEEKMKKVTRFYYLISCINKMIIHVKDEETLFKNACRIAVDSGKFKMVWVGLQNNTRRKLIPVMHAGEENGYLSILNYIPIDNTVTGKCPSGMAFLTGKSIVCNDIANDDTMKPLVSEALTRGYHSSIALPIKRLEKIVGVFTLFAPVSNYFDKEEVTLLEEVAGDISFTLGNLEKEDLRKVAEADAAEARREKEITLNRINDGVVSLDLEWRYTFLNDTALANHSLGRSQTLGKYIWDVHPELLGTSFEKMYRQAMSTGRTTEAMNYYPPMDKWFIAKAYPSADGLTIFYQDISDRKSAEEEIAAERIFSETILNSLPGIFYLYDQNGKFLRWNNNFEVVSGYRADEITTMHPLDFFASDERDLLQEKINLVFTCGKADVTAHFYTKDRVKIPYCFNGYRFTYKGVDYLMGMGIDISERIEAEKAEAELQKRLKAIFTGTSDAILLADDSGKYVQANPAATRMLGYTEEELLTKMSTDIISQKNNPALWDNFIETGQQTGTIELTKKDGTSIICRFNGSAHILPGLHLSILTDITKRTQAEEMLRQSEARLVQAQKVAKVGSWETDLSDLKVTWSEETYRIFEIDPDNFKGSHNDFLAYVHPDDRLKVDKAFARSLNKHSPNALEHRIVTPGGIIKFVEEKWQIFFDSEGKPLRVLGTCQDITERKITEDALQESEAKYRLLFANNPMPMWVLSQEDSKFLDVNEAAVNHYGYSRSEFLSMSAMDIRPKEEHIRYDQFSRHSSIGLNHAGLWKHRKKDGSIIDVDIVFHDIHADQKNGRLILANDVTEKLKATEEIKYSYKKMQELTAHLQHVREDERTRIAREIHDELGQQLTGLKMDASWISKKMNPMDTIIHQKISSMLSLINDMVKTVRRISSDLRPGILDDLGLIPALEWNGQEFENRTGIKSTFRTSFPNFNPERNCATHIFRIHQEALTNIARHAHATEIETSLEEINGYIYLTIQDNGIGFDTEQVKTKKSWGLVGMKERALLFHGELSVESIKQSGTLIRLKIAVEDLEVTE